MDYLYENAPLVEVIAELHWSLMTLDSTPDSKIDPHYEAFLEPFLSYATLRELTNREELVPSIVPLELLPNKPRLRLRSAENEWPLVQVGPGIVTANIVPPYQGWRAFQPFLHQLIEALFATYPLAARTLHVEKLQLRYIDAFDESFGFDRYAQFASYVLEINAPLSEAFLAEVFGKDAEYSYLVENRLANTTPEGSHSVIKCSPGTLRNKKALILEMYCESNFPKKHTVGVADVVSWFDEAHKRLHFQFDRLTTPALKELMGEKKEIAQ